MSGRVETQPGSRAGVVVPVTLNVTMAPVVTAPLVIVNFASGVGEPLDGTAIQRVPSASCHVASAPGVKSPVLAAYGADFASARLVIGAAE